MKRPIVFLKWLLLAVLAAAALLVLVSGALLYLLDPQPLVERAAKQIQTITGRELVIDGPISIGWGLVPHVAVEDVSFANAPWGTRPAMARAKRVEIEVALLPLLSRRVEVRRVILIEPDIILETDVRGVGNWVLRRKPSVPPDTGDRKALGSFAISEVAVEAASLAYRDDKRGETRTLAIDDGRLTETDNTSRIALRLRGAYQEKRFSVEGTTGSISELSAEDKPYPFHLSIQSGGATIRADGSVTHPLKFKTFSFAVHASGEEFSDLVKLVGHDVPKLGPYRVAARVTGSVSAFSLDDIDATIGNTMFQGKLAAALAEKRPKVSLALSAPVVDLAQLLSVNRSSTEGTEAPTGSAGVPTPAPAADRRVFSDRPFNLAPIKSADVNADVRVEKLLRPDGSHVGPIVARVTLKDGVLTADRVSVNAEDTGALSVRGTVDASRGEATDFSLQIDGRSVQVGNMLDKMKRSSRVNGGTTDVTIDIRGRGNSIRSAMAGLNGNVVVASGPARIDGVNFNLGWGGIDQVLNLVNPFQKQDRYLNIRCVVIRLPIRDGIVTVDRTIAVEAEKFSAVAAGTINFKTEAIDFGVTPVIRKGISLQDLNIGSGELAKLIRVRGSLGSPTVGIAPTGTARFAVELGAAVATGGATYLAEILVKKASADPTPCKTALNQAGTAAGKSGEPLPDSTASR